VSIDLNGRVFRPLANSEGGRVTSSTFFHFAQSGQNFTATYSGAGITDGHIIGAFHAKGEANLLYHSRAETGTLEAGTAKAIFRKTETGQMTIDMDWQWLNGTKTSGQSHYVEVSEDDETRG